MTTTSPQLGDRVTVSGYPGEGVVVYVWPLPMRHWNGALTREPCWRCNGLNCCGVRVEYEDGSTLTCQACRCEKVTP